MCQTAFTVIPFRMPFLLCRPGGIAFLDKGFSQPDMNYESTGFN
jgi:hypothetical protein